MIIVILGIFIALVSVVIFIFMYNKIDTIKNEKISEILLIFLIFFVLLFYTISTIIIIDIFK